MKITLTLVVIVSCFFILSCQANLEDKELRSPREKNDESIADSAMLVKTASVSCKVKDVKYAASQISAEIKRQSGLIMHQQLDINEAGGKQIRLSNDSVQLVKVLRPALVVTAKVPSEHLEDFISFATSLSYNVSHSQMDVEDMRLSYLRNKLEQQNRTVVTDRDMRRDSSRLSDFQQLSLLDDITERKINNYKISDDVQYSTVSISLYQPDIVTKEIVANTNLDEFLPTFGTRLANAFSGGVVIVKEMIIGLVYLWVLIILGLISVVFYKRFRRYKFAK